MKKPFRPGSGSRATFALLGSLLLFSCSAEEGRHVEVLYEGQQCPESDRDLILLRSQDALANFVGAAAGTADGEGLPLVNYPDEMAVAVMAETRPTAGYSLELSSTEARVIRNKAVLDIAHSSSEDAAAQVLTSPCLVLKLDVRGIDAIERADTSSTISITGKDVSE